MTDPRNTVTFQGIGYEAETFLIDDSTITYEEAQPNGSSVAGRAVTLSAGKTVALAGDGDVIAGKLIQVERDGKAVVQTGGHVELPGGDGATLTLGAKIVGALGPSSAEGYIRSADSATAAELLVARGLIIDPTETAAVVVRLETAT